MLAAKENPTSARIIPIASQPVPPGTDGHGVHPTDCPSGARWYVLRVAPNSEARVSIRLELFAGVEVFLPTWTETSRWSDRQKQITRPLFAGYLFALFDRANATQILQTPGVFQILGTDELSAIPDQEIAALRRLVDSPAPLERVPYVAGSSVSVEGGNWAGAKGIVERTRGSEFATIRMLIFGRDTPVEIAVADLKAL